MKIIDFIMRGKRTKVALGIVWPLICLYCVDETGKIDKRLETDEYALAYIWFAIQFAIKNMNIKNANESWLILTAAFIHIFPNNGYEILKSCVIRLESDDNAICKEAAKAAFTEIGRLYGMNIQNEAALERAISNAGPSSLQKHFQAHYR